MDINARLAVLDRIYGIYEEFVSDLDVACRRSCAHCCTRNVTLTTLEGYKIVQEVGAVVQPRLLEKMTEGQNRNRFQPRVTINGLAELCMRGEEPPDESSDPTWGPCSLLKDNECPVYRVRPFGCRCMISRQDCGKTGYAEMAPFVLTVNNLFLQYIEHIDAEGYTGNLTDVLVMAVSGEPMEEYGKGRRRYDPVHLIANRPIEVLMIPPEHRVQIRPLLQELREVAGR